MIYRSVRLQFYNWEGLALAISRWAAFIEHSMKQKRAYLEFHQLLESLSSLLAAYSFWLQAELPPHCCSQMILGQAKYCSHLLHVIEPFLCQVSKESSPPSSPTNQAVWKPGQAWAVATNLLVLKKMAIPGCSLSVCLWGDVDLFPVSCLILYWRLLGRMVRESRPFSYRYHLRIADNLFWFHLKSNCHGGWSIVAGVKHHFASCCWWTGSLGLDGAAMDFGHWPSF